METTLGDRFAGLFRDNAAAMLAVDPDSATVAAANAAACLLCGRGIGELQGARLHDLFAEPDLANARREDHAALRLQLPDGGGRDVEVFSGPLSDNGRVLMLWILHDVTRGREAAAALDASRELYRIILSNISDAVFLTDDAGRFVFVCPNVHIAFGYTAEEIMAMGSIQALLGPDRFDEAELAGAGEAANVEYDAATKTGETLHLLVNVKQVDILSATRLYSCRDYSERKRGQVAFMHLFNEKEHYRRNLEAVLRSLPDAVAQVDEQFQVRYANDAARRLCPCFEEGERCGARREQECAGCLSVLRQTLQTSEPVREYRIKCGHMAGRELVANSAPLLATGGDMSGAVLILRDISRMAELERRLTERPGFQGMVGKSKPMQEIYDTIERLADVDTTVLVMGESGAGKELVADGLHNSGARAGGPLVKVNCAALSENLLESELFGHVRGAFTGAMTNTTGRFRMAHKGTIFLDEIGEIPPRLQLKLLRGLDTKVFERVGESTPYKVDVQIVAATNVDLTALVREGRFREDLYYRLKVMVVRVPALRERMEDMPLLVQHFLEQFSRQFGKTITGVSEAALARLMSHRWPGNVRELRNVLEHCCILCPGGVIQPEHLPREMEQEPFAGPSPAWQPPAVGGTHHPGPPPDPGPDDILRALDWAENNKALAARKLGISRPALYRRMHKFGL